MGGQAKVWGDKRVALVTDVRHDGQAADRLNELVLALFVLSQRGECPAWVRGAGRELCRDYGYRVEG